MIGIIRGLFLKAPEVGDIYIFDDQEIPPSQRARVRVIEIEGKWVEYEYADKEKYGERTRWLKLNIFNHCYYKEE